MSVPLLDLKPQNVALESEFKSAFERVLRSGHYILGPEIQNFERSIAEYLGSRHAISVSSGTDAILLALMTLGIGPGDEVICPSFTFFATAGCVARTGATPIFADSCPVCFNIDPADAAKRVTSRTKAIIPVHLFGQAAAMDRILKIAKEHHLYVIEDAAQALGAKFQDRSAGTLGAFSAFSFFPSKNLGCLGDGGLLVTDDDSLAEHARLLRTHGAKPKYYHKFVGANFRMDALTAALLAVKLSHLDSYAASRSVNASIYTERFGKLPGVALSSLPKCPCSNSSVEPEAGSTATQIRLPIEIEGRHHVWNQYTLRVSGGRRDQLREFLTHRKIGSEIYYPVPMHRQECFSASVPRGLNLPVADRLANECLSIPVFPELTGEQREEVISARVHRYHRAGNHRSREPRIGI